MESFFFNAEPTGDIVNHPTGFDREYDADAHAAFFAPFFSEAGVMAGRNADACRVTVGSGATLAVAAGAVYIKGRMALFDGSETVDVRENCKIVARMNKTADVRSFQLLAVGSLMRTEDVYDLELASVAVTAVPGGYEPVVTDTRTFLAYMGQPAYYPPTAEDVPYVMWLYTLGLPLTEEQRDMVESNPSLMGAFNASLGAGRALAVPFTAGEWRDGALTIPQKQHGRQSEKFSYTLRHRLTDGKLYDQTFAVRGTAVGYEAATGDVVLKCKDAYGGEIVFVGAAMGVGSVDMITVNGAVDAAIRAIQASTGKANASALAAESSAEAASSSAGVASDAAQAVKAALDNLPPGAVPVINDLTTGGAAAALSAEMGKALDAAMSKKVNWSDTILYQNENILEWALAQSVPTSIACSNEIVGVPSTGYFMVNLDMYAGGGWRKLTVTEVLTQKSWFNIYNVSAWSGWTPIATATPPQELALPLAEGIKNVQNTLSSYRKRQNGEVVVNVCIIPTAQIQNGALVATLPHRYRPKVALGRYAADGVFLGLDTTGLINTYTVTGAAIPAGRWIEAGFDFVASTGP